MIVVISDEAESDLEEIGDHIARDNPIRAVSFVRSLREKCLQLHDMSKAFPLVPGYEQHEVRRSVYRDYLIFYRIDLDRLVVLHILHGAMDYTSILFPGDPMAM